MPRSRRASRSAAIVSDRADGLRPLGSRVTWRSPSGPEAAMATWLCDEATATGATKSQARGSFFDPYQCPVRPTIKNCVSEIEADKCPLKKTTSPFPRIRNSAATGTNGKRRAASKCRSFRASFSTSLLFRCMDMLQVDQSELASDDPLLFRELQGVCALCRSKDECAQDLAHQFDDARWDRWWVYCPNSAMLAMIGAVQNCGRAAQYLKPLPTTLSHLR